MLVARLQFEPVFALFRLLLNKFEPYLLLVLKLLQFTNLGDSESLFKNLVCNQLVLKRIDYLGQPLVLLSFPKNSFLKTLDDLVLAPQIYFERLDVC